MEGNVNMGTIDPCPCPSSGDVSFSANEKLQMNGLVEITLSVTGKLCCGWVQCFSAFNLSTHTEVLVKNCYPNGIFLRIVYQVVTTQLSLFCLYKV